MIRTITCVLCPNSCELTVTHEGGAIQSIAGNLCPKGTSYAAQELADPRRTIATSIPITGGELPLASVRVTAPIPKDRIMDVMAEINRHTRPAPVHIGDVVIENVLGLNTDVIITKDVAAG